MELHVLPGDAREAESEGAADAAPANEAVAGEGDDARHEAVAEEVVADTEPAHEAAETLDSDPVADALASGDGGLAGSQVDNMPTLPMWPPNPDIPKSSLKRWSTNKQDRSPFSLRYNQTIFW